MGNYSTLYGKICIKDEDYRNFRNKFKIWRIKYHWDVKFNELFVYYKDYTTIFLTFNPRYNSYKLLGYPENFEEFMLFWESVTDLIYYGDIIADVEDSCMFIIQFNLDIEDIDLTYKVQPIKIKSFRTNTIKNDKYHYKWHKDLFDKYNK